MTHTKIKDPINQHIPLFLLRKRNPKRSREKWSVNPEFDQSQKRNQLLEIIESDHNYQKQVSTRPTETESGSKPEPKKDDVFKPEKKIKVFLQSEKFSSFSPIQKGYGRFSLGEAKSNQSIKLKSSEADNVKEAKGEIKCNVNERPIVEHPERSSSEPGQKCVPEESKKLIYTSDQGDKNSSSLETEFCLPRIPNDERLAASHVTRTEETIYVDRSKLIPMTPTTNYLDPNLTLKKGPVKIRIVKNAMMLKPRPFCQPVESVETNQLGKPVEAPSPNVKQTIVPLAKCSSHQQQIVEAKSLAGGCQVSELGTNHKIDPSNIRKAIKTNKVSVIPKWFSGPIDSTPRDSLKNVVESRGNEIRNFSMPKLPQYPSLVPVTLNGRVNFIEANFMESSIYAEKGPLIPEYNSQAANKKDRTDHFQSGTSSGRQSFPSSATSTNANVFVTKTWNQNPAFPGKQEISIDRGFFHLKSSNGWMQTNELMQSNFTPSCSSIVSPQFSSSKSSEMKSESKVGEKLNCLPVKNFKSSANLGRSFDVTKNFFLQNAPQTSHPFYNANVVLQRSQKLISVQPKDFVAATINVPETESPAISIKVEQTADVDLDFDIENFAEDSRFKSNPNFHRNLCTTSHMQDMNQTEESPMSPRLKQELIEMDNFVIFGENKAKSSSLIDESSCNISIKEEMDFIE